MKTKEELNALKEEIETLNKKLAELTEEELAQVSGGIDLPDRSGGVLPAGNFMRFNPANEPPVYEPDVADLIFHLIE